MYCRSKYKESGKISGSVDTRQRMNLKTFIILFALKTLIYEALLTLYFPDIHWITNDGVVELMKSWLISMKLLNVKFSWVGNVVQELC